MVFIWIIYLKPNWDNRDWPFFAEFLDNPVLGYERLVGLGVDFGSSVFWLQNPSSISFLFSTYSLKKITNNLNSDSK